MKVWLWIIKLIIWYNKFDLWILHQVDVWYNEIIKNMSNNHQNLISVSSLSYTDKFWRSFDFRSNRLWLIGFLFS